ncbi:VIT domain-containing protein [Sphaerisporangium corydalis]|uniref:VIT domain-containing protein n=1 Tax=Sphaerisporangium corydalis TaxID=1441875 RepID=A0ABV9EJV3_9ACTN|nr:VIT domain-containing protein [Sphaerisporangium corydalis]
MTVQIASLKPGEYAPLPDAGLGALRTGKGNLPLESVEVDARITALTAGVEVAQGFRNPYDVPLEATYIFPLPGRAAVTAFRMEADDRVVEGVLKERGQARRDYDQALAEGRRAAIAEEERPDVFTMRVGNIVPGERVTVRLTLSQPLPYEDGAATFRFPLVVAPRYIPGTPLDDRSAGDGVAPDTGAVPDASRISPPVLLPGFPDPVRLSLTARVDPAGLDLREIRSSLHVVTEEEGVVRLQPGERLDRDFVLRLAFTASASLTLVPDHVHGHDGGPGTKDGTTEGAQDHGEHDGHDGDGDGTFTLTVLPPAPGGPDARRPRDVALLLDRSGSMSGWKMVAARRAAARIVDTLTFDDRFAVLSFDSVVERPEGLSAGLVAATDRNRYRAVEHLARLEARGGTEILDPMEQALGLLDDPGRERVLVLVTDGQVGNEDQILERLGARLAAVRVHTVGIDRAVNAEFLGRLAGLGSGRCELVESEDRLDEAMEHIHRRIGSPLVTGLTLKADGLGVLPATVTHLGSLYSGVPLTVSGRFHGPATGAVTVHGVGADGPPWERRLDGTPAEGRAPRAIWARSHLRRLEDRYAIGEHGLEREIVETSLRHGVLCRFTAFVAVDSRVVAEGGPGHRVLQPVESPSGWAAPAPPVPPAPMAAAPMAFTSAAPAIFSVASRDAASPAPGAPEYTAGPGGGAPGTLGGGPGTGTGAVPGTAAGAESGGAVPGWAPVAPTPFPAPPAGARRGFGRSVSRKAAPAARPVPHSVDSVRPQLAAELARLRERGSLTVAERRLYLADLGSRLTALAAYTGGEPALSALARELSASETPGADVDALWGRAVAVLTELTTAPGGPDIPDGPDDPEAGTHRPIAPRPSFWKRS